MPMVVPMSTQVNSILGVYPNPTVDNLTLQFFSNEEKEVVFNFYDVFGQIVLAEKRQVQKGSSTVEFEVYDLPAGTYFVRESGIHTPVSFVIIN